MMLHYEFLSIEKDVFECEISSSVERIDDSMGLTILDFIVTILSENGMLSGNFPFTLLMRSFNEPMSLGSRR
jgi:hypothetical protein